MHTLSQSQRKLRKVFIMKHSTEKKSPVTPSYYGLLLQEPQTGFHIAFKMLDADGNEQVEKKEFFKLQKIIGKQDELKAASGDEIVRQEPELEGSDINTMLLVHFFGRGGKEKLQYCEFCRAKIFAIGYHLWLP
uniref:Uncharacterized protein n=1 Tax=Sphaerodactylus townsendi TaxID=933632 RepID=A0ACB8FGK5_9SAUR